MEIVAYLRVSTDRQETDNQKARIEAYAKTQALENVTYIEANISSRASVEERQIDKLYSLPKGSLVISYSLDRLGRSVRELSSIIGELRDRGIDLHILDKNLRIRADKTDIASTILITVLSLTAEIERDLVSTRTKTALQRIRLIKKLGRPSRSKLDSCREEIQASGKSVSQLAREYGCARGTIRALLKQG